jgi:hypothetical protein
MKSNGKLIFLIYFILLLNSISGLLRNNAIDALEERIDTLEQAETQFHHTTQEDGQVCCGYSVE